MIIDKDSDREACQMLTDNAKELTSAISEALCHTHSACIRVNVEVKKELDLTQHNVQESDHKHTSQYHKAVVSVYNLTSL